MVRIPRYLVRGDSLIPITNYHDINLLFEDETFQSARTVVPVPGTFPTWYRCVVGECTTVLVKQGITSGIRQMVNQW